MFIKSFLQLSVISIKTHIKPQPLGPRLNLLNWFYSISVHVCADLRNLCAAHLRLCANSNRLYPVPHPTLPHKSINPVNVI